MARTQGGFAALLDRRPAQALWNGGKTSANYWPYAHHGFDFIAVRCLGPSRARSRSGSVLLCFDRLYPFATS